MELYDLVSSLIEPAGGPSTSDQPTDCLVDVEGDATAEDASGDANGLHTSEMEEDIYGTHDTVEDIYGTACTGQELYIPQRRNIKYLISNFQSSTDDVTRFLPQRVNGI